MVQNDKKLRQVDYHSATDYADGMYLVILHGTLLHVLKLSLFLLYSSIPKLKSTFFFIEINAKVFETSSKTGHNVGMYL